MNRQWLKVEWRVGRKVGRTIYAQPNDEPRDSDPLIGVMDTPELAQAAVDGHNARLALLELSGTEVER